MPRYTKLEKIQIILEFTSGYSSVKSLVRKYQINETSLRTMIAAYQIHGEKIFFDPPEVDGKFRLAVIEWMLDHNASITETAAHFGYLSRARILEWKKIYLKEGPNGLLSILKGNMKTMPEDRVSEEENRLAQLERENLKLKIENEALKLLASMRRQTGNLPESSANSRRNSK